MSEECIHPIESLETLCGVPYSIKCTDCDTVLGQGVFQMLDIILKKSQQEISLLNLDLADMRTHISHDWAKLHHKELLEECRKGTVEIIPEVKEILKNIEIKDLSE